MKKYLMIFLTLILGVVLVACNGENGEKAEHEKVFNEVTIVYNTSGDSSVHVTGNLTLPTTTAVSGATIKWVSLNSTVISDAGVVTRQENDIVVKLLLQVTIDGSMQQKEFEVTVKGTGDNGSDDNFTVTFNANGGDPVQSQTVVAGGKVSAVNPTRAGHTFEGWYTDTNLDNKWDFATDTVTANITLYAKWSVTNTDIPAGFTPISSVAEFMAITDYTARYILTADIDFNGAEAKPLGGWGDLPEYKFSGTFDGNGYALMNFKITGSLHNSLKDGNGDSFGASLFPTLTGVVRNLNIVNATITGDGFSGGIAGLVDGSILNVYFQGTVTASKSWGSVESWAVPAGAIAGILGGSGAAANILVDAKVVGGHVFFGYAFSNASSLYAVKETMGDVTLHTGQEKEEDTPYLVKSFTNAELVNKGMLTQLNLGIKWKTDGATRPYIERVDGNAPSWALQ